MVVSSGGRRTCACGCDIYGWTIDLTHRRIAGTRTSFVQAVVRLSSDFLSACGPCRRYANHRQTGRQPERPRRIKPSATARKSDPEAPLVQAGLKPADQRPGC